MKKTRDELQLDMMEYLYDEMTEAEAREFEEALSEHPELQEELTSLKGTLDSLSPLGEEATPEVPAPVKYAVMREARAQLTPKERTSWVERLLQTLTQPAMGTAFLALVVTGVGITQMEWGVHDEIGNAPSLADTGVPVEDNIPAKPPHANAPTAQAEVHMKEEEAPAEALAESALPQEARAKAPEKERATGFAGSPPGLDSAPEPVQAKIRGVSKAKVNKSKPPTFQPTTQGLKAAPQIAQSQKKNPLATIKKKARSKGSFEDLASELSAKPKTRFVDSRMPRSQERPEDTHIVLDAPNFIEKAGSRRGQPLGAAMESDQGHRPKSGGNAGPAFGKVAAPRAAASKSIPVAEPVSSAIPQAAMAEAPLPPPGKQTAAPLEAPGADSKEPFPTLNPDDPDADPRLAQALQAMEGIQREKALTLLLELVSDRSPEAPIALIKGMEFFCIHILDEERAKKLLIQAELTGNSAPGWNKALQRARYYLDTMHD